MKKDLTLLLLRLTGLALAVGHGWGKVSMLASGGGERFIAGVQALGFPLPVVFAWAAALAEFAGGLLVGVGLASRVAASVAAVAMFVAGFIRHRFHQHLLVAVGLLHASPETVKKWGNPELALMYLVCFLGVALMGAGRLSIDHLFARKRPR